MAAVVALGAAAAPQDPASRNSVCARSAFLDQAQGAANGLPAILPDRTVLLTATFRTGGERALDAALDAFGELAARLKQL